MCLFYGWLCRFDVALFVLVLEQADPVGWVGANQLAEDLARAIRRAVVDDDQLEVGRQRRVEHLGDCTLDALALVVDRHQDREHVGVVVGSDESKRGLRLRRYAALAGIAPTRAFDASRSVGRQMGGRAGWRIRR